MRQGLSEQSLDRFGLHFYLLSDVFNVCFDRLLDADIDLMVQAGRRLFRPGAAHHGPHPISRLCPARSGRVLPRSALGSRIGHFLVVVVDARRRVQLRWRTAHDPLLLAVSAFSPVGDASLVMLFGGGVSSVVGVGAVEEMRLAGGGCGRRRHTLVLGQVLGWVVLVSACLVRGAQCGACIGVVGVVAAQLLLVDVRGRLVSGRLDLAARLHLVVYVNFISSESPLANDPGSTRLASILLRREIHGVLLTHVVLMPMNRRSYRCVFRLLYRTTPHMIAAFLVIGTIILHQLFSTIRLGAARCHICRCSGSISSIHCLHFWRQSL